MFKQRGLKLTWLVEKVQNKPNTDHKNIGEACNFSNKGNEIINGSLSDRAIIC